MEDLDDAELDALLDEDGEQAARARALSSSDLDDALDLLPDEPELEDDEAPARDATGAAVEAVPDLEPDDDEPDAIEPEPLLSHGGVPETRLVVVRGRGPSSSRAAAPRLLLLLGAHAGPPSGGTSSRRPPASSRRPPNAPDPTFVNARARKRTGPCA